MAETEIEAFNALRRLLVATSTEAVEAADMAAADVYYRIIQGAAPVLKADTPSPGHPAGQLRASVKIIKSARTKLLSTMQGNVTPRIFVGPEKRAGYYGFFIEHGWVATGPRRRQRAAVGNTHSQRGVTGGHKVDAHPWFEPAVQQAESQAVQAAHTAFSAKLQELDSKG